jgi:hypothetical protein
MLLLLLLSQRVIRAFCLMAQVLLLPQWQL